MRIEQRLWTKDKGWQILNSSREENNNRFSFDIVFFFGSKENILSKKLFDELKSFYPKTEIIGGSTGGEILNGKTFENSVVVTAIDFESTKFETTSRKVLSCDISEIEKAGKEITEELSKNPGLKAIIVFCDGVKINGSVLVNGLKDNLNKDIIIFGGLTADYANFKEAFIGLNEIPIEKNIVAVGLYGENLNIIYSSFDGCTAFGPKRLVTKSKGNILYELDEKPALDLYIKYLGEEVQNLPKSAAQFPIKIISPQNSEHSIVRTVFNVDWDNKSLIFAGDVPEGYSAQLMRASLDRLIEGAEKSALDCFREARLSKNNNHLGFLVSCVARKIVYGTNVEEEIDIVSSILGKKTPTIGFYSNGEIAPHKKTGECEMHNHTMTISLITEK